jgi:hypothetical protein
MRPAIIGSKSVHPMPGEVDGLQPAAKGGGKRRGVGRLHTRWLTKALEQRAKAAETAAREESSQDVAASTRRSAAELTPLRAEVEHHSKENVKLAKQIESLQNNSSRRGNGPAVRRSGSRQGIKRGNYRVGHCACRGAREGVQQARVAVSVNSTQGPKLERNLIAAKCREKAKEVKAHMARRAYRGLRPLSKRIKARPVGNRLPWL